MDFPLASLFASIAPKVAGDGDAARWETLEVRLAEALSEARLAFPEVQLDDGVFVRYVARLAAGGAELGDLLQSERAADLYLAAACADGNPRAHARFDRRHLERVPAYLAHLRPSATLVDETRQALREKLLLPRGSDPPRLLQFTGRGDLDHFVCIAAIRTALSLMRSDKARPGAAAISREPDEMAAIVRADPELEFIEARHRQDFAAAFRDALADLTSRERSLLRLHFLQRLPVVQIARAWGAHRTTVTRWLEDACRKSMEGTREKLRQRLSLSPSEADSLLRRVESQLNVAIPSLLRHPTVQQAGG